MNREIRFAVRRLRHAPLFTVFAVVTLALGIGVTTATYSFLYGVVRPEAGVRDRGAVVTVRQQGRTSYIDGFSGPEVADVAAAQTAFSAVGAFTTFRSALAGEQPAQLIAGEAVSGNLFQMLGVEAALGRMILPDDDRPGAPAVVLLSDRAWRRQFGANPHVVGTTVRMAGRVFEVVGVAPPAFRRVSARGAWPSVWVPLSSAPAAAAGAWLDLSSRDAHALTVVARLKPGRALGDAQSEMAAIGQRFDAMGKLSSRSGDARIMMTDLAFDNQQFLRMKSVALFVLSLPAIVLLIACTNLGNLILSRGVSRQHEFAVHRALGASRWRIVREQLIEGGLIAIAGGGGGLLVAAALLEFLRSSIASVFGSLPELQFDAPMDAAVLAAAAGFALLAILVSSLAPALELTRGNDRRALTSDAGIGAVPRWRGRSNLIAMQVTASVALFLITALGVTALTVDTAGGERAGLDRVAFVGVPFSGQQRDEPRVRRTLDTVLEQARATPGVGLVAVASLRSAGSRRDVTAHVTIPSRPFGPALGPAGGEWVVVTAATPGIFTVLGRSIRSGRAFDDRDAAGAPPVAVVSESLAKALFQTANATGRDLLIRIDTDAPTTIAARIVGITANTYSSSGRANQDVYLPFAQHFEPDMAILARATTTDVAAVVTILRTALREADPDVAVSFSGRADQALVPFSASLGRLYTAGTGGLAVLALVLSMTGLYGVLSHVVAKRTRELGLRMALGADARSIMRLVLKDGFRPIVEGLGVGLGVAVVIRLLLQPSLEKPITAFDPIAFVLAAGPLLLVGAIACYLPARRAARVEPNVALRDL